MPHGCIQFAREWAFLASRQHLSSLEGLERNTPRSLCLSRACVLCRHLAASEGAYQVTEWLLAQRVDINSLDRFKRTPLEVQFRLYCHSTACPSHRATLLAN